MPDEIREGLQVNDNGDNGSSDQQFEKPFSDDEGVNIGLIGFPRAGKTMTMLTLDRAMLKSPWQVQPDNLRTLDYLEPLQNNLSFFGELPPATDAMNWLTFKVSKKADFLGLVPGTWPPLKLVVLDAPGGGYIPGGPVAAYNAASLEYISRCSGIIFLVDPEELWQKAEEMRSRLAGKSDYEMAEIFKGYYFRIFSSIFNRINLLQQESSRKSPTQQIYIAYCLTKMDLHLEQWHQPREFAETIVGPMTMQIIDQFCRQAQNRKCRWFSVSAIGSRRFDENSDEAVTRMDTERRVVINPDNIQPEGIRDALEWVLNSIHDDLHGGNFVARWRNRLR